MAAPTEEALSFISKFMHLGQMGLDASLQFTSSYGRIYAHFYADFGYVQDPTILLQQPFIQKSYQPRRRARHKRTKKVIKDEEVASRNVEVESQNVNAYDSNSIEEEVLSATIDLETTPYHSDTFSTDIGPDACDEDFSDIYTNNDGSLDDAVADCPPCIGKPDDVPNSVFQQNSGSSTHSTPQTANSCDVILQNMLLLMQDLNARM